MPSPVQLSLARLFLPGEMVKGLQEIPTHAMLTVRSSQPAEPAFKRMHRIYRRIATTTVVKNKRPDVMPIASC